MSSLAAEHRSMSQRDPAKGRRPSLAQRISLALTSCPFRWQLIIAVLLLALITGVAGGVLAVFDARTRAAVETSASVSLATQHISERAKEVHSLAGFAQFATSVTAEMRSVRHVAVRIADMAGNVIAATPNSLAASLATETDVSRAPGWFIDLVQPDTPEAKLEVAQGGTRLGQVFIVGEPKDEIQEVWQMLQQMAILWGGVMIILAIGLYFIIGHILNPLVAFASGLHELEDGHYAYRIASPRVKELAVIADGFNKLAQALDCANSENSDLYRQLVAVQEDERRLLSRELHDEFGPCLFGLTAGLGTLERHAQDLEGSERQAFNSCIYELKTVTVRLKSLTRSLLQRLRPVALGRVTLAELVSELVSSFQSRHSDVRIGLSVADVPLSFGEAVDVTIYRSIQEGLTNALRHGAARRVDINLDIEERDGRQHVCLRIEDNGRGMADNTPRGYGLSGMSERAKSLGGSLTIEPSAPLGTILTIIIPFQIT